MSRGMRQVKPGAAQKDATKHTHTHLQSKRAHKTAQQSHDIVDEDVLCICPGMQEAF
jgi:hypothetical protein